MRTIFMPASINSISLSLLLVLGPMVQMIDVLRVALGSMSTSKLAIHCLGNWIGAEEWPFVGNIIKCKVKRYVLWAILLHILTRTWGYAKSTRGLSIIIVSQHLAVKCRGTAKVIDTWFKASILHNTKVHTQGK